MSEDACHSVFMSSRFTKKSLVNVSGRLVKTPSSDCPTFAFRTRMPPTSTVISGAVSVSMCARSTSSSSAELVSVSEVVAEPVCGRFEHGKRVHVGLLLQRVRAPRREGNLHVVPGVLRSLLDGRAPAQNDHVSERDHLPAGLRAVEVLLDLLQGLQHLPSSAGLLTSQSFCGARRMRAPFAPPRLSVPRNVAADAQAVETSWEMDSPDARILPLRAAMSCSPINS